MPFRLQFTVASLLLASLMGCSESPDTGAEKPAATVRRKGTIGFSTLTLTNPFFKIIATDNYQGGRLAGEALVKLIGESGGQRCHRSPSGSGGCLNDEFTIGLAHPLRRVF